MILLITSTMFLPKVEKLVSNVLGKQANSFGATVKSINNFVRKFEWIFSLKWIYLQFYEQTKIIIHIDFCDQISDKGKSYFFVVPYELVYLKIMRKIMLLQL